MDVGSPADKAGVKRGDRLLRYTGDGVQANGIEISQSSRAAGSSDLAQSTTISISKPDVYPKSTVSEIKFLRSDVLFEDAPRADAQPIDGLYLAVNSFDNNLDAQLKRKMEFAYGVALGIVSQPFFMGELATVVLDLRTNSGGLADTVSPLAYALMGAQFRKGAHFSTKTIDDGWHNPGKPVTQTESWHVGKRETSNPLFSLKPKRLIVLTSPYTCSAAELLIHGIREQIAPSSQIIVIGENTCGKPYGYGFRSYFGYEHAVLSRATVDAQGQPAYAQGIKPDCEVKDSFKGAVLSEADKLWQAARYYIKTGQCVSRTPEK